MKYDVVLNEKSERILNDMRVRNSECNSEEMFYNTHNYNEYKHNNEYTHNKYNTKYNHEENKLNKFTK